MSAEEAESQEVLESADDAESADSVEPPDNVESADNVEPPDNMESADNVKPPDNVGSANNVKSWWDIWNDLDSDSDDDLDDVALTEDLVVELRALTMEFLILNTEVKRLRKTVNYKRMIRKAFMGQTLSEPVTTKETSSCANSCYRIGSSCMQGWRINMEDAHTHLLTVPEDSQAAFFAVYDGHGGSKVSQYAGIHLHKTITSTSLYAEGKIVDAIKQGFLALDEKMKTDEEMREEMSGTTAVVVLIKDQKIYCGNVGDSRAVACVSGVAQPLSFDHKPANEAEARRIVAAGGWVEFNRVNGNLALSRALGDFAFKKSEQLSAEEQIVTAYPDVTICDLTYDHEFIVLACDGIWDVMSNQEVVDFCRDRLADGREPEVICEELLSRCLAPDCQMGGLGCDNMTAVLVCLLQEDSRDAYIARCSRKPADTATTPPAADAPNNADNDAYATPQVSPIRIESNSIDFLGAAGTDFLGELSAIAMDDYTQLEEDEQPPKEFAVAASEVPEAAKVDGGASS